MKKDRISIQKSFQSSINDNELASIDIETDYEPTKPLLHKKSRFLYILSGKAKIKILDKEYIMEPGVLIALLPWQISEIIEVTEPVSYYLLVYNFDFVNEVLKRDFNINNEDFDIIKILYNNNTVKILPEYKNTIEKIFIDLKEELGFRNFYMPRVKKYTGMFVISKLTELIVHYCRMVDAPKKEKNNLDIDEIFQYMYLNSTGELRLSKLSRVFLMSESSISNHISTITGLGFYDLLNEMRLSKAQFLLAHTNLTLEEIAKILKFSSPAQLSKAFTVNYGIGTKKYKLANKIIESKAKIRLDDRSIEIINYINDHYDEDIDILDLSSKFNLSTRHINEILNYFVEQNFSSFLNNIRINKASDLLLNTDLTINEIASRVGYNSTRTFTRNFVNHLSLRPTEFREKIIEQKDK